jgi:HK97 family phage portal protein
MKDSWLLRTAHAFASIERSIKARIEPGALYPPPRMNGGVGPLVWPGWEQWEKQAQNAGEQDLRRAKTAVTSPWVFADVQAIANEFSTSELVIKERRGAKLEDVDNHPLELLWESPNEHMGRSFVTAFWAWSYVLASKAYLYWVPDTSGTAIMEVWPIPPWMIRPVPDKDDFISGYVFKSTSESTPIRIPSELITYSHSVNLFDARDGLSFLVAADTEIRADLAASMWNLNFFDDNNGVPDGLIGLDPNASDPDVDRVRMELRDFFGGTKRGLAVARSNDLKYTQFGRSQKDMEFGQGREFASKVIGRTLGFPDGYWSDLANRANAEQARRTMISGAVWPLLVRLSEDMNAKRRGVVQRWYGPDFRVEFKDIRPEDKEAKRAELAAYQPFLLVNELREMVGQEALDDVRGLMLVAEITKGAPLPGTKAAQELEDAQAEKDAQAAAAAIEANGGEMSTGEEAPAEPPPPILGYHIEQGVVSRNEARERLALPAEDETKSQNLRDLQAMLAVLKMATDAGIDLEVAAGLVGLDIPPPAPAPLALPPPAFGGEDEPPPEDDEVLANDDSSMPNANTPPTNEIVGESPVEVKAPIRELAPVDFYGGNGVPIGRTVWISASDDELKLWRRKAIKAFKAKGNAAVPFNSIVIASDVYARINDALPSARSILEIKSIFNGDIPITQDEEAVKAKEETDEIDALLDDVDADARAWVEEASGNGEQNG